MHDAQAAWNDPKKRQTFYEVMCADPEWNLFASAIAGIIYEVLPEVKYEPQDHQHLKFVTGWFMAKYVRMFREREK